MTWHNWCLDSRCHFSKKNGLGVYFRCPIKGSKQSTEWISTLLENEQMCKTATAVTLIKLVAILEHGDTTVLRHLSWTTKLHTATKHITDTLNNIPANAYRVRLIVLEHLKCDYTVMYKYYSYYTSIPVHLFNTQLYTINIDYVALLPKLLRTKIGIMPNFKFEFCNSPLLLIY